MEERIYIRLIFKDMIQDFKNIQSNRKDLRNFGLLIGTVLSCIGIYLFYRYHGHNAFIVLAGLIIITLGLTAPVILKPLQKIWMGLALVLNFIVTHIILVIFFYVCITPLAIIARIVGKKFLDERFKEKSNSIETYWKTYHDKEDSRGQLEKQF